MSQPGNQADGIPDVTYQCGLWWWRCRQHQIEQLEQSCQSTLSGLAVLAMPAEIKRLRERMNLEIYEGDD